MIAYNIAVDSVNIGDVLEILRAIPDNTIDLTVTSPPYNKRNKSQGWLVDKVKYSNFDDHMSEEDYQSWQIEVLKELWRVAKPGGSVFYNHKLRWETGTLIHPFNWLTKSEWHIKQEIVWDRGLAANMRGWRYWQVDERIYWLYKPVNGNLIGTELEPRHAKFSSIWRIKPAARSKDHPARFPIELPTRIINSILKNPRSIVLDPFCGTGTTLIAAKLLGHCYIGIDISPVYVDYTKNRLSVSENELDKVKEETDKHMIGDTFQARKKRGTVNWPFGPKPQKQLNDNDLEQVELDTDNTLSSVSTETPNEQSKD